MQLSILLLLQYCMQLIKGYVSRLGLVKVCVSIRLGLISDYLIVLLTRNPVKIPHRTLTLNRKPMSGEKSGEVFRRTDQTLLIK